MPLSEFRSRELRDLRPVSVRAWLLVLAWSSLIGLSLAWSISHEYAQTRRLAENEARAHFNKDQAFRRWATRHGGVYVPRNARTPANPYLAGIPERDIQTPSGIQLTLLNPGYMLRQVMDEFEDLYGIRSWTSGLNAITPLNKPDTWQRNALRRLADGAGEVLEYTRINDQPHLRLMRPMETRPGCMKCHAQHGFQVGQIDGGVSIAVAMAPYLEEARKTAGILGLTHGGIWLMGLAGIWGLWRHESQHHLALAAWADERERQTETLRLSEKRWIMALEGAGHGVWDWNAVTDKVFVSRQGKTMLGFAENDAGDAMADWQKLVHPDDLKGYLADLQAHLRGETSSYSNTRRVRRKNGTYRWILDQGQVWERDQRGKPLRAVGTYTDVTAHKLVEDRLQRTLAERDSITATVPDIMYMFDAAGRLQWWNRALEKVTGWDAERIRCTPAIEFFLPEDRPRVQQAIGRAFLDGSEKLEARILADTGARTFHLNGVKLEYQDQMYLVGSGRDLTERLEAQQELERERGLFVAGPTVVFRFRNAPGWPVEYVSPNVQGVLGHAVADLKTGRPALTDLIHPDDREQVVRSMRDAVRDNIPHFEQRYRLRHGDGEWRWIYDLTAPERDADGEVTHFHGYLLDITREKRALDALEEAKDKAEAASQSKSAFVANISHELRTPLNSLLILARLLAENRPGNLIPDQLKSAQIIQESGRRLLDLINELLDLSRIEAGRIDVAPVPVDIGELIRGLERRLAPQARDKGLTLQISLDPKLPRRFLTDPRKLEQILTNLIGNAVKFTQQGGVRLEVLDCRGGDRPTDQDWDLSFVVQDTGPGIQPEHLAVIFDAFRQVDGSQRRRHGGTGLGLTISLAYARALGGDIDAESRPGSGSRFTLFLSEYREQSNIDSAPANEPSPPAPPNPLLLLPQTGELENAGFAGETVLIMDADMRNAFTLSRALRVQGLQTLIAADAAQAITKLRQAEQISALVTHQTNVNPEACEQLRALLQERQRRTPPVIALISEPEGQRGASCRAFAVDVSLQVPVEFETLLSRLRELIDHGGTG